ncbi:MAG TPA: 30S ribosomal protein S6 [Solirubrobacteraceae bacterium]|jgi:small subunit ribosomal protein S6|nr:30S ribosomal protein S6 [Solirubrobacteraceae bacterium]
MTLPAPTYDLVLLLDPQADDATRAKVVADSRSSIEAQGELLRHDDWGERALTYPIDRKASAQYHLLQFHVSDKQLLSGLDRTLRLADEVLRFRIIKLAPGVAAPPDMSSSTAPARRPDETVEATAAPEAPAPVADEPAGEPAGEDETAAEATPAAEASPESAESAPETAQPGADVAVGDPS